MDNPSLQILLVEDNLTDALLLQEALDEVPTIKFVLTHVERLDAGLECLNTRSFDAVLLDLGLPDSQGLETLSAMQSHYPDMPIMVLSGLDDENLALMAVRGGAQDYMVKGKIQGTLIALTIRYAIERKRNEQILKASEVGYRRLFETTQDGIFILDAVTGQITDANPFLEKLLGYTLSEFIGKRLWEIAPFRDKAASQAAFATLQEKGFIRYQDLPLMAKSGKQVDVEFVSNVYAVGSQRVVQCNIRDITERKLVEQQLADHQRVLEEVNARLVVLSTTDELTGLKNYRALQEALQVEFDRANRYQTPLSLILLDVDKFKQYNDAFGHPAGDETLRALARLLQHEARTADFVARYGGEEFAIILVNTNEEGAWIAAEKFRAAIEAAPWLERAVTVSLGITTKTSATVDVIALISAADTALYYSKEHGRNMATQTPNGLHKFVT